MSKKHWAEIDGLHQRFGRKLNPAAARDYVEAVEKFSIDLVQSVIKHLRKTSKSLPTPAEVEKECIASKKYFEEKAPASPDSPCAYFSVQESSLSKHRCTAVTSQDRQNAQVQGWPAVCVWHYSCLYAKAFPESHVAKMVKSVLKDANDRRVTASVAGEDAADEIFFLRTLRFDPLRNKRAADQFLQAANAARADDASQNERKPVKLSDTLTMQVNVATGEVLSKNGS